MDSELFKGIVVTIFVTLGTPKTPSHNPYSIPPLTLKMRHILTHQIPLHNEEVTKHPKTHVFLNVIHKLVKLS